MPFEELFHMMRQLYDSAAFPTLLADASLRICWCNLAAEQRLPLQRDDDGHYQWFPFLPAADILYALQSANSFSLPLASGNGLLFLPVIEQDTLIGCQVIGDVCAEKPPETAPQKIHHVMEAYDKRSKLPLTIIFSALGLLARDVQGNRSALEYLKVVLQNCYRLLRFSKIVSDIAYLKMEGNALHLKNGDVGNFISGICDAANVLTSEIGITISCQMPPEPVLARFDPARLQCAFLNLVSNACLYTRPNNRITVRVESVGRNAVVMVSDHGMGMDAGRLAAFMDAGNKLPPKPDGEGNVGLGLFLVKTVVEKHGGTLVIDSRPGKGTNVAFTLPLCSGDDTPDYLAQEGTRYLKNRFSAVYVELSDVCTVPMP